MTVSFATRDITALSGSGDYTRRTTTSLSFNSSNWNVSQPIVVSTILDNQVGINQAAGRRWL